MTRNQDPSDTSSPKEEEMVSGQERVESVFSQLVEEVSREDVHEVLDSFDQKLERVRERPVVKRIGRGLRRARLFYKMLRAWWNDQFTLPWRTIAAITAALLYFINPMDLVPDFLFLGGLVDDATVLYLCYRCIESDLWTFVEAYDLDPVRYGLDESSSQPENNPSG